MAPVLHPSPNDRGSATHLQERLLGDVPKLPLVPMECGSRGRPSHDGRIPSTQTLREPATVGRSDVADGAHSPRDLAVRPVHRPRRPGILPLATGVLRKRSEEHTSELQSRENLVCRLLLEKKKKK